MLRTQSAEVLDQAREMAILASVEGGTPEDCADAALVVVLECLRDAPERFTTGIVGLIERMLEELRR